METCAKTAKYSGIKNLLFDLGGVIMDIERSRCVQSLTRLGMDARAVDEMLGLYVQQGAFKQLEAGQISPAEFYAELRRHFAGGGRDVTDRQLEAALNDFLVGIPVHRLVELRMLRRTFMVYMLSNTNPIMMESKIAHCFRAEGLEMDSYFDGTVLSYKARCLKPGREIFDYAVGRLGIVPGETLFLDDSQKNIDAAATLGFATVLVPPGTEFIDALSCISLDE